MQEENKLNQNLKPRSNKGLVITLIVLLLLAIGLIIGIVVVSLNRNNSSNNGNIEAEEGAYSTSMHNPELITINKEANNLPLDEAKKLYENTIKNAKSDKTRTEARVEYGIYLFEQNDLEGMLEQFDQIDENTLDDGYKILLFNTLRDYYYEIDDDERGIIYNEKMREVIENSKYGIGA